VYTNGKQGREKEHPIPLFASCGKCGRALFVRPLQNNRSASHKGFYVRGDGRVHFASSGGCLVVGALPRWLGLFLVEIELGIYEIRIEIELGVVGKKKRANERKSIIFDDFSERVVTLFLGEE
jgi:hypothetical protein